MPTILKISDAASIGIHTMYVLANNPDKLFSTKEIATTLGVSENHLSKILQRLTKVGIVKSIRGPRGGFLLNKKPSEISLKDVYEAIDGPLTLSGCLLDKPVCDGNCVLGDLIQSVNRQVIDYFKSKSVNDFIRK
jgi:Rrf2 family protein